MTIDIGRKALYNLLRMNWVEDPSLEVESWQVENYREKSDEGTFRDLKSLGVHLDVKAMELYVDEFDSPEALADSFIADEDSVAKQDRIYLLIFELWRRLAPYKPSLSVFADELDHQIYLYDQESDRFSEEDLQQVLEYFVEVLEDNDSCEEDQEIFDTVATQCANDIQAFLYDYFAEQIDLENYHYAADLIDRIYDYLPQKRSFDFLKVRLLAVSDVDQANEALEEILEDLEEFPDLELGMEVLQYYIDQGEKKGFLDLAVNLASSIETERDCKDLFSLCKEFFQNMGDASSCQEIEELQKDAKSKKGTTMSLRPLQEFLTQSL